MPSEGVVLLTGPMERLTLLILSCCFLIQLQPIEAQIDFPNGSFEEWSEINGRYLPVGWYHTWADSFQIAVTEDAHSGSKALWARGANWCGSCPPFGPYLDCRFFENGEAIGLLAYVKCDYLPKLLSMRLSVDVDYGTHTQEIGATLIDSCIADYMPIFLRFEQIDIGFPRVLKIRPYGLHNGSPYISMFIDDIQFVYWERLPTDDVSVELQLWPNPNDGVFRIKSNSLDIRRIQIFDSPGVQVYEREFSSPDCTITLEDRVPPGVYYVVIELEYGIREVKKVTILP